MWTTYLTLTYQRPKNATFFFEEEISCSTGGMGVRIILVRRPTSTKTGNFLMSHSFSVCVSIQTRMSRNFFSTFSVAIEPRAFSHIQRRELTTLLIYRNFP